jgi:hypothetical protein
VSGVETTQNERGSDSENFAHKAEEIAVFMHELLFAYQKTLKDILGSGAAVFLQPTLNIINKINKQAQNSLNENKDVDEAFDALSKSFLKSEIVKEFRFEKIAPLKYVLHIRGCVWAPHIHNSLKPKELTCPFALIGMAVYGKVTKTKVNPADSEYFEDGSRTEIGSLSE